MADLCPSSCDDSFPTDEVAAALGVSEATVRSWKKRHENKLLEGSAWFQTQGRTFWSIAGVIELATLSKSEQGKALVQQLRPFLKAPALPTASIGNFSKSALQPSDSAAVGAFTDMGRAIALEWVAAALRARIRREVISILTDRTEQNLAEMDALLNTMGIRLSPEALDRCFAYVQFQSQKRLKEAHQ